MCGLEEENMWVCPKCGRSFKNTEQGHYCGKPPETIEAYIDAQPEAAQGYLRQVNAAIQASIPGAQTRGDCSGILQAPIGKAEI